MSLKELKEYVQPWWCPKCHVKGKKLEDVKGVYKCTTDRCDIKRYYPEHLSECKTLKLKRFNQPCCPNCDVKGYSVNDVAFLCKNIDCRILRY